MYVAIKCLDERPAISSCRSSMMPRFSGPPARHTDPDNTWAPQNAAAWRRSLNEPNMRIVIGPLISGVDTSYVITRIISLPVRNMDVFAPSHSETPVL